MRERKAEARFLLEEANGQSERPWCKSSPQRAAAENRHFFQNHVDTQLLKYIFILLSSDSFGWNNELTF
jgi:hypothetical protein